MLVGEVALGSLRPEPDRIAGAEQLGRESVVPRLAGLGRALHQRTTDPKPMVRSRWMVRWGFVQQLLAR